MSQTGKSLVYGGAAMTGALLALLLVAIPSFPALGQTEAPWGQDRPSWQPQSWWVRLRTTAYSFEQAVDAGKKESRLGGFQHYAGSASGLFRGRFDLRVSGRLADDLQLDRRVYERERLYVAYVQANVPEAKARARAGRMFLHEGPTNLTLDGAWASVRPLHRWDVRAWAGAPAPASMKHTRGSFERDPALGLRIAGQPLTRLRLAASIAYREHEQVVAERPVAFEATAQPNGSLRATALGSYDLEQDHWQRVEFLGQYQPRPNLPMFSAQYLDRFPSIDAASYFARFADSMERIRVARVAARHEYRKGWGGEIEYFGAFVDKLTSSRIGVAALLPYARIGYAARLGDAGEESRWFGDVHYQPLTWVSLEGGAAISTYALLQDAPDSEQRDLTTAFGRVRADLRPGCRLTLEVQSLNNPFYSKDVRFLAGLDLFTGRGTSRFGLGSGGWFQ